MTYYIYHRKPTGFVKQLGFAFDKAEAIKKAKAYAMHQRLDVEVHGRRNLQTHSVKIFEVEGGL